MIRKEKIVNVKFSITNFYYYPGIYHIEAKFFRFVKVYKSEVFKSLNSITYKIAYVKEIFEIISFVMCVIFYPKNVVFLETLFGFTF